MCFDKMVYGLIRKFGVVKRRQLDAFFLGRERAVKRAVKRLGREGKIYANPLTGMVAVHETACRQRDHGTLEALWVLAALKQKGLAEDYFPAGKEEYPARIVVTGKKEMYDILYVGKEETSLAQSVLKRIYLPDCKHLVIVEDMSQTVQLPIREVFAFCRVSEEGRVTFYEGYEKRKTDREGTGDGMPAGKKDRGSRGYVPV